MQDSERRLLRLEQTVIYELHNLISDDAPRTVALGEPKLAPVLASNSGAFNSLDYCSPGPRDQAEISIRLQYVTLCKCCTDTYKYRLPGCASYKYGLTSTSEPAIHKYSIVLVSAQKDFVHSSR